MAGAAADPGRWSRLITGAVRAIRGQQRLGVVGKWREILNPNGDEPQGTGDRFLVSHTGSGHEWKFRVRVEKKHSTEPFPFVVHPAGITTIYAEELLHQQLRDWLDTRNQR